MATTYAALALFGGGFGWQEILLVVLVILLLFGGRKIPELARGLGRGLQEFKKGARGLKDEVEDAADDADEPAQPTAVDAEPTDSAEDKDPSA